MIKNIVFDMGGVIMNWDPHYIASKLSNDKEEIKIIEHDVFGSQEWINMDQGLMDSKEAIASLSKGKDPKYQELISYAINNWYHYFEPLEDMKEYIIELDKQGYDLYLLSNCSLQFDIYSNDVESFKYLKEKYISARVKLLKPDKSIYQDFLDKYHLEASECVFIDDNKENAMACNKVGMHGFYYQRNIEELDAFIKSI